MSTITTPDILTKHFTLTCLLSKNSSYEQPWGCAHIFGLLHSEVCLGFLRLVHERGLGSGSLLSGTKSKWLALVCAQHERAILSANDCPSSPPWRPGLEG